MDKGFTKIHSTFNAFAALKADGSITIEPSALRAAKENPVE
jgi:aspartate 1-decarboxylase